MSNITTMSNPQNCSLSRSFSWVTLKCRVCALIFNYDLQCKTLKFSRWQGALSIKSKMFLLAAAIFRLILVNTESINFACHPWFLTWIVMHVIRTFRVDQVPEISRFSTSLNNNWFNNFLCRNNYEKSNS